MVTKIHGYKTYYRLLSYLKHHWLYFTLGIIFTAIASSISAGFTWFLKPLLNQGFINPNITFIKWLPAIVATAYLSLSCAAFLGDYFITWVARHIIMRLQQNLFKKYLNLPTSFFNQQTSGKLIAKLIYNVEQVAEASTNVVLKITKDVFYIAGLIVVMLSNSILLTLIFIATIPCITIIFIIAGKIMKHVSLEVQNSVADIANIAEEAIEGGKVINSFGTHNYESSKFAQSAQQVCNKQIQVVIASSLGTAISRFFVAIAVSISIYLATSSAHILSAGAFMATIAAMLAILKPLKNLTDVNNALQKGIAGAESIFAVLDQSNEPNDGTIILNQSQGHIRYEHVYFCYPGNHKNTLIDINFEINPGQTIAIVGRSGSGKSTLTNLLLRFYNCCNGNIYLDNINTRNIMLSSLRAQFSLVSQNITLFNDTISKNIAYGNLSHKISSENIHKAAADAYALEFINALPQGFATVIGENGILLSGGQRQRIAIARALLKNAPILILDEATSVLDSESEKYIQAALTKLMQNKTTLVIAHRLSTIEKADKIIVLHEGRIVEHGTHYQLLAQNKYYAKLHNIQFKLMNNI